MSCLHRGPYIQRGRGIGSSLTAMFKGVIPALQLFGDKVMQSPITKEVIKTGKRAALDAGLNVASDVLGGKKLKPSLSENVTTAKKAVTKSLLSALEKTKASAIGKTPVVKRKRVLKRSTLPVGRKSRGKRSRTYDIFEEKY